MCVYCVCMWLCVSVLVHGHVPVCVSVYVHGLVLCMCMWLCCVHVCTWLHVCTCAGARADVRLCISVCTCACLCMAMGACSSMPAHFTLVHVCPSMLVCIERAQGCVWHVQTPCPAAFFLQRGRGGCARGSTHCAPCDRIASGAACGEQLHVRPGRGQIPTGPVCPATSKTRMWQAQAGRPPLQGLGRGCWQVCPSPPPR